MRGLGHGSTEKATRTNVEPVDVSLSAFGELCLAASYVATDPAGIDVFVQRVVCGGGDAKQDERRDQSRCHSTSDMPAA